MRLAPPLAAAPLQDVIGGREGQMKLQEGLMKDEMWKVLPHVSCFEKIFY